MARRAEQSIPTDRRPDPEGRWRWMATTAAVGVGQSRNGNGTATPATGVIGNLTITTRPTTSQHQRRHHSSNIGDINIDIRVNVAAVSESWLPPLPW